MAENYANCSGSKAKKHLPRTIVFTANSIHEAKEVLIGNHAAQYFIFSTEQGVKGLRIFAVFCIVCPQFSKRIKIYLLHASGPPPTCCNVKDTKKGQNKKLLLKNKKKLKTKKKNNPMPQALWSSRSSCFLFLIVAFFGVFIFLFIWFVCWFLLCCFFRIHALHPYHIGLKHDVQITLGHYLALTLVWHVLEKLHKLFSLLFQKHTRIQRSIWHFEMQLMGFCSPLCVPLLFLCIVPLGISEPPAAFAGFAV